MRRQLTTLGRRLGSRALRYQQPEPPRQPGWWHGGASRAAPSPPTPQSEAEEREARLRRLEAVLLLARDPLNSRRLAQFANLADGTEARTLVRLLNQHYDEVGRAFRVEEVAGGFQLLTRPMFANWLRRQQHLGPEIRLSPPAMETLAVVAYRQPVLRADIEAIRGVNSGEILRQLMERDLVRVSGRSDELGRPYLYSTTKHFLRLFGLSTLDALPQFQPLDGAGPPADSPAAPPDSPSDDSPRTVDKESEVTVMPADKQTEWMEDATDPRLAETLSGELDDDQFDDEEDGEWDDDEDEEYEDDEEEGDEEDDEEYEDDDEEEDEDYEEDEEEEDEEEDDDEEYEDDDEDDDEEEEEEEEEEDEDEVDDGEWEEVEDDSDDVEEDDDDADDELDAEEEEEEDWE